jgi:hypothetical protein
MKEMGMLMTISAARTRKTRIDVPSMREMRMSECDVIAIEKLREAPKEKMIVERNNLD